MNSIIVSDSKAQLQQYAQQQMLQQQMLQQQQIQLQQQQLQQQMQMQGTPGRVGFAAGCVKPRIRFSVMLPLLL